MNNKNTFKTEYTAAAQQGFQALTAALCKIYKNILTLTNHAENMRMCIQ